VASRSFVPIRSGTSASAPRVAASAGCSGRNSPSTTGAKASTPGVAWFTHSSSATPAAVRAPTSAPRSAAAASFSPAPSSPTSRAPNSRVRSGV
jgi:hypothetical protein